MLKLQLTLVVHAQEGYCSRRVCVCVSVRLLSYISPLEYLFVLKILSRTRWAMEVKIFSLKHTPLRRTSSPSIGSHIHLGPGSS